MIYESKEDQALIDRIPDLVWNGIPTMATEVHHPSLAVTARPKRSGVRAQSYPDAPKDEYRDLWRSVFHAALADIRDIGTVYVDECRTRDVERDGRDAIRWIMRPGDEPAPFSWVCAVIGVDADLWRTRVANYLKARGINAGV